MSIVRFIADLHFGHKNMAIKRGFQDEFYHDEYIIEKWNSVVHKKDVTYILGDVTMETKNNYDIIDRLNGRKIVILGNHDMKNHVAELLKHVDQVAGMVKYSCKGYRKTFLTHCPVHPMELEHGVGINIHGHIHENLIMFEGTTGKSNKPVMKEDERYICVSCEHVDYTPQHISELMERYETKDKQ